MSTTHPDSAMPSWLDLTYLALARLNRSCSSEEICQEIARALKLTEVTDQARQNVSRHLVNYSNNSVTKKRPIDLFVCYGAGRYGLAIWEDATLEAVDLHSVEVPNKRKQQVYRIIRDTNTAKAAKQANNYQCQVCGSTLRLPSGLLYAESHHLQPLGGAYDGPDILDNLICVCAGCHVRLDYGCIRIEVADLKSNGHTIGQQFVDYHNNIVVQSPAAPHKSST